MGSGHGVDIITLIIIVIMVCVATFSCTIFGRFCFDEYCRIKRGRSKNCPHGGGPHDLPCGVCARLATDMDLFSSWRPYHPSVCPNIPPANLNYAALLAAERQNTYFQTIGHHHPLQDGSPGATDLMETQKELPGPNTNSSSLAVAMGNEESGTFKRLGIRPSLSGRKDLSGLARQLENRNLSPIQQTPPDSHFPHDLSIALSKKNPNSPLQTSQTSSFGSFRQRRSNSFHQTTSAVKHEYTMNNNHNLSSMTAKSSRSIQIPGLKKMFSRHVATSDLTKSPGPEEHIFRPSPMRRRIYQSPGVKSSPVLLKSRSIVSPNDSLAAPTTIEIESDKEVDEVDVIKNIGAPGSTVPMPLSSVLDARSLNVSASEGEEVFKPPSKSAVAKPPRLTAGGKIRTFRHRSLNDSGGSRHIYEPHHHNTTTNPTSGFRLKRFKSLEGGESQVVHNFCSYCGQYLIEHSKSSTSSRNGPCSEMEKDRKKYSKPSFEFLQPAENIDEGEKTSSNSLGSPGITSILDTLGASTNRNSCISVNRIKTDEVVTTTSSPPPMKQHSYVNIATSEAEKFSLEIEKRGPLLISDTMFKIPNSQHSQGSDPSKVVTPNRKSFDVDSSVKTIKSPIKLASKDEPNGGDPIKNDTSIAF